MKITKNNFISLINPSSKEINDIALQTKIESKSLKGILDEEELSRIKIKEDYQLVVANYPYRLASNKYTTIPFGIVVTKSGYVICNSIKEMPYKNQLDNLIKHEADSKEFILNLFTLIALDYQKILTSISDELDIMEQNLAHTTSNKELLEILTLEKSLVYFINSIRFNKVVLEKLSTIDSFSNLDLMYDSLMETNQAIEMASLYKDILNSTSDTFGAIISNNQNKIMKMLAAITIIFSVPTIIFSFFGMNVEFGIYMKEPLTFIIILGLSIILAILVAKILKDKKLL